MPANDRRSYLQAPQGMVQVARTDRSSSNDKRAVCNRLGDSFVFFGSGEYCGSANGRASLTKRRLERIHYPQAMKSKITHRPGSRADVQRIAHVHQHDA